MYVRPSIHTLVLFSSTTDAALILSQNSLPSPGYKYPDSIVLAQNRFDSYLFLSVFCSLTEYFYTHKLLEFSNNTVIRIKKIFLLFHLRLNCFKIVR